VDESDTTYSRRAPFGRRREGRSTTETGSPDA